ncbi:solute carrier family 35 member F2-like isoform X1 [Polypterus senegalus]|uniref:solute carrier family 35 member F2-like isoform X1 n=1 Tax=Polypterus senegalus TaxID=55291 RepID=UPI001966C75C|nr:solute carrier family 35 member F2-like isoform X1 [Polypterus senegalus]XP_039600144.1 solute carrier family 35 member F2-like isoform X1 [Polypterus senegalus]
MADMVSTESAVEAEAPVLVDSQLINGVFTVLLQKRMEMNEHITDRDEHENKSCFYYLRTYMLKEIFTWRLFKTIVLGQGLSVLICGTGITSQYLANDFSVNTPMLQSFINYTLLFLVYVPLLSFRREDKNLLSILKKKWWKYLLLGIADVEANYMVVKAYQYTTLTSVQLLDCFVIPVLMALSWFILKTRFRIVHYVAVCICLLGAGTMVGADVQAGRDQGSGTNILLGDVLVLGGAALYAVSNVCQEYTVKNLSQEEFLGMVGLFGTFFSGIQMAILECTEIAKITWNWQVALLFTGYAICMFGLYNCMPLVIKIASATAVNLSLLTADLFSLFFGFVLFQYKFSILYILSFVIIIVGFISYNSVPTFTLEAAVQPAVDGVDNPVSETEETYNKEESAIDFPQKVIPDGTV